ANGDTTLGGQQIKAGDMLLLGLAAGNVDEAIRPDPATPVHHNRAHLSFSAGTHECPGQDIGRIIADTGIDILLTRLPDIALSIPEEDLTWRSSTWARHLTALPVSFAARAPQDFDVPSPLPAPPAPSTGTPAAPPWRTAAPEPAPEPESRPEPRPSWRTRLKRLLRLG
ncbi:cytochrome P450, partial [Streptomyces massasporeus]